jgi:hypothetical protein
MKSLLWFLVLSYGISSQKTEEASIVFGPPVQNAVWKTEPTIIICDGAPLKPSRVKHAVLFWKNLGYSIGDVVVALPDDFSCLQNIVLHGEILINLAGQDFHMSKHLAVTKTWIHKDTNQILKAKIEIMSGWGDSERIIEHEIGHALGWRDYNQTGHIMHSEWSLGGYRTKGLKNEDRTTKE